MALEFRTLNYDDIVKLAEDPNPEVVLQQMSVWELQLLKERIDNIVNDDADSEELFGNIMRLKTFVMLAEHDRPSRY